MDLIDRYCIDGAAVHLKIKAYHADVARGDLVKSKLKHFELVELLIPLQWYLKHLDPDGKKTFREVKGEVSGRGPACTAIL